MRLLLVEHNPVASDRFSDMLEKSGNVVDVVIDFEAAQLALRAADYDLLLLDWQVRNRNGTALLQWLRQQVAYVPAMVVLEEEAVELRVRALNVGADDCLVRPLHAAELNARVRAITRRALGSTGDNRILLGELSFNLLTRQAEVRGQRLTLTPRETAVLEILLLRRGRVVNKAQMRGRLCGWNTEISDGALELYAHRLRRKLSALGISVQNVRGHGYVLRPA